MGLGSLNSSNAIIFGYLNESAIAQYKVSGEMEPEKKRNESDMEIKKDDGEDTEVDKNSEYDACSESGEHEGLDNC